MYRDLAEACDFLESPQVRDRPAKRKILAGGRCRPGSFSFHCLRKVADNGPVREEFSRQVLDVVFEEVALILRQRHFLC